MAARRWRVCPEARGAVQSRSAVLLALPASIVGDANTTRFCDPLETHCNIDPVTKDIVLFDNDITDVNADAELDPLVLRHVDILFGHAALNFVGTSDGVDHAGELGNSAVPGILDNTSVMLSDFGIENRSSKRFQSRQRAFFVDPYQAARARDICRQNSRQSPLYMIAAQDAPPRLGEIECLYSTIVGPCPAMRTSEMGQDSDFGWRPDDVCFTAKNRHSRSNRFHSPVANHSKVDPADQ